MDTSPPGASRPSPAAAMIWRRFVPLAVAGAPVPRLALRVSRPFTAPRGAAWSAQA